MVTDMNNADSSEFTKIFLSVLDKYAPKKQKFTQANTTNFKTKDHKQTISLQIF